MRTNLVPRRSRLVGRAKELRAIADAFSGGARLVTLVGPGGVGKTRLAQEHGLASGSSWEEVRFCDLAHATDLDGVGAVVADALEVILAGGNALQQLARALADRPRSLVVLDNLEQLGELAADAARALLEAHDGARLLATSREPLRLRDELVIEIEPLEPHTEAVDLLVDRLGPKSVEREALSAIGAQLEGIPLALELAAPRIAMLGAAEVLARLGRGLDVLGGGPRDMPARQRTMGRAVEWSWDLLDPAEQQALVYCCAFRGGFTAAAAEAVLDASIDLVESLRHKSLLRSGGAVSDPDEPPRFELYVVVRAHLGARAEGLPADVRRRHAAHYVAWGEELAAALDGAGAQRKVRALAMDRDNLLAALEWGAGDGGDRTLALRAALVLSRLTWIRGPLALQVRVLDRVLDAPPADAEAALLAKALLARGNALRRLGELTRGRADLEAALARAVALGDTGLQGEALTDLAALEIQEVNLDVALDHAARARALLDPERDPGRCAAAEAIAGNALHHSGRVEAAVAPFERALALYRRAGNQRGEGWILIALAAARLEVGRADEAIDLAGRAVALQGEIGDRWRSYMQYTLAQARLDAGDLAGARADYEEARRLALEAGDPYHADICLGLAGVTDCLAGDTARGAEKLAQSVERLEWGMARPVVLGFFGAALAALGRIDQAREVLDTAERELGAAGGNLLLEAVRICRGMLDLALADAAARASDDEAARAWRLRAAARAGAARAGSTSEPPLTKRSVEVRLALALLERALGPSSAEPPAPALLVHVGGTWFTDRAGARVDLGKRPLQRRLLAALADRRLRAPGEAVSAEELLAVAWPGERILPDAAKNRLYVALSRLRALGLDDVLQSADAGGYRLDPAVPVRMVHDP